MNTTTTSRRGILCLCAVLLFRLFVHAHAADSTPPLNAAAAKGDLASVKEFVKQGTDLNSSVVDGWTPLLLSVREGHTPIVEYLLSSGADGRAHTTNGNSALHVAVDRGHLDVINVLIKNRLPVNEKNPKGVSPLLMAAAQRKLAAAKLLVEAGADVNASGPTNDVNTILNVLMVAAWTGDTNLVGFLLDHEADPNLKTPQGNTAFLQTAKYPHAAVLKLLLQRGAKIDLQDDSGYTALIFAAYNGRADNVRILIEAGADLDAAVVAGAPYGRSRIGGDFAYDAEIYARQQGHPGVADIISAARSQSKRHSP